jgi:hypothetical protein
MPPPLQAGGDGVQVLFLDQGHLPFAGLAAFESITFQAFAGGDRYGFERFHGFTTGKADADPFHPAGLGEGVEQGLKWGLFRHWPAPSHSGGTVLL